MYFIAEPGDTVTALKAKIAEMCEKPVDQLRLVSLEDHTAKPLEDALSLNELQLFSAREVFLLFKLEGSIALLCDSVHRTVTLLCGAVLQCCKSRSSSTSERCR